jgi:hypothetical protein
MDPQEVAEKCRKDLRYILTPEELKGLGRDGWRRLIEILLETPEFRVGIVGWYQAWYELWLMTPEIPRKLPLITGADA